MIQLWYLRKLLTLSDLGTLIYVFFYVIYVYNIKIDFWNLIKLHKPSYFTLTTVKVGHKVLEYNNVILFICFSVCYLIYCLLVSVICMLFNLLLDFKCISLFRLGSRQIVHLNKIKVFAQNV